MLLKLIILKYRRHAILGTKIDHLWILEAILDLLGLWILSEIILICAGVFNGLGPEIILGLLKLGILEDRLFSLRLLLNLLGLSKDTRSLRDLWDRILRLVWLIEFNLCKRLWIYTGSFHSKGLVGSELLLPTYKWLLVILNTAKIHLLFLNSRLTSKLILLNLIILPLRKGRRSLRFLVLICLQREIILLLIGRKH